MKDYKQKAQEINQISFEDLFNHLWIQTFKKWMWVLWIYYNWEKTDWWILDIKTNLVNDFSQERPKGDIISFLQWYLNLDFKEVIEYCENNNLIQKQMEDLKTIWEDLKQLNQKQIDYLKSRWIDYEKVKYLVKDFKWWIWVLNCDNDKPIWITSRLITDNPKNRFTSLSGYSTNWLYRTKLDPELPLIVVEGMFDYLTLRQYYKNVVWLKNWQNWLQNIIDYSKDFEIYYIPDWDEQWKKSLEELKSKIDFHHFKLDWFKDINEAEIKLWLWKEWINKILSSSTSNIKWSIASAFEKLEKYQKIMKENWMLWIKWPFEELDKITSWIIPWKVYTIWAYSNTWKSKFSYVYVNHFLQMWKKVHYYSLEVDSWMILLNLFANKENKPFSFELKSNLSFFKNLKIYDDIYNLTDIIENIEKESPDIVFIDFLQNIQTSWSDYEKMTNIATKLQQTAIKTNCTMINLSQLSNETAKEVAWWKSQIVSLKWSWALFSSSDIIFILRALKDWFIELSIKKNKYWKPWDNFIFKVDFPKGQFTIINQNLEKTLNTNNND